MEEYKEYKKHLCAESAFLLHEILLVFSLAYQSPYL